MMSGSIASIIEEIEVLTKPDKAKVSLQEIFEHKIKNYEVDCKVFEEICDVQSHLESLRFKYVALLMQKSLELRDALLSATDVKEALLSIKQQKIISSALELSALFCVVYYLPEGVGINLEQRFGDKVVTLPEPSDDEKITSMQMVCLSFAELMKEDSFRTIIVSKHLGDILSGLFALSLPIEWNNSLNEKEKSKLHEVMLNILHNTFKPYVIRELMILFNTRLILRRFLRTQLSDLLMSPTGVISTIKAVMDIGDSAPNKWVIYEVLTNLLVQSHIKNVESYREAVYPQISLLLYAKEVDYVKVAVYCTKKLYKNHPKLCNQYILNAIMEPLQKESYEEEVTKSIEALYNCFGHYSMCALHPSVCEPIHTNLFRLLCKISTSVSHVKDKVDGVVRGILKLGKIEDNYERFIYGSSNISFAFGDGGGIKTLKGQDTTNWAQSSELFLTLVNQINEKGCLVNLFKYLVSSMIDLPDEKKMISARVLSDICLDEVVEEVMTSSPELIIEFIKGMLLGSYPEDMAGLGIVVLEALVATTTIKKGNWEPYKVLAEPLREFKNNCKNLDIRAIALELYSTILTHGGSIKNSKKPKPSNKPLSDCDSAMKDAVDPLLPVRAHGIHQLGKLIHNKDPTAVAKKEAIFCIFKENLKEEDSYVYLSAIYGLAFMAATFPDEVLVTLCEQYNTCKNSELRLKVGDTLFRVTHLLNEMAVVYKDELITAFLSGCTDDDYLVRASSLSNLGEVCKILSFRIHKHLTEIIFCIQSIIDTDKCLEPKRAAVFVLSSLLKGLGSDALTVLEPLIAELYRKLKFIYNTEKDDITKLHAQLALEEINKCVTLSFTKGDDLVKKISILGFSSG